MEIFPDNMRKFTIEEDMRILWCFSTHLNLRNQRYIHNHTGRSVHECEWRFACFSRYVESELVIFNRNNFTKPTIPLLQRVIWERSERSLIGTWSTSEHSLDFLTIGPNGTDDESSSSSEESFGELGDVAAEEPSASAESGDVAAEEPSASAEAGDVAAEEQSASAEAGDVAAEEPSASAQSSASEAASSILLGQELNNLIVKNDSKGK